MNSFRASNCTYRGKKKAVEFNCAISYALVRIRQRHTVICACVPVSLRTQLDLLSPLVSTGSECFYVPIELYFLKNQFSQFLKQFFVLEL